MNQFFDLLKFLETYIECTSGRKGFLLLADCLACGTNETAPKLINVDTLLLLPFGKPGMQLMDAEFVETTKAGGHKPLQFREFDNIDPEANYRYNVDT